MGQSCSKSALKATLLKDKKIPVVKEKACVNKPFPSLRKMNKTTIHFAFDVHKSPVIPWASYKLDLWEISLNDPAVKSVWELWGDSVREIVIQIYRDDVTVSDFKNIFDQTPNLEVLKLEAMPLALLLDTTIQQYASSTLMMDLEWDKLPKLPKLKSISLPHLQIKEESGQLPISLWRIKPFWMNLLHSESIEVVDASCFHKEKILTSQMLQSIQSIQYPTLQVAQPGHDELLPQPTSKMNEECLDYLRKKLSHASIKATFHFLNLTQVDTLVSQST